MGNSLYETDYEQWLENQAIALNAYPADARKLAIKESKYAAGRKVKLRDESEYPLDCTFSLEQILDDDWYPN